MHILARLRSSSDYYEASVAYICISAADLKMVVRARMAVLDFQQTSDGAGASSGANLAFGWVAVRGFGQVPAPLEALFEENNELMVVPDDKVEEMAVWSKTDACEQDEYKMEASVFRVSDDGIAVETNQKDGVALLYTDDLCSLLEDFLSPLLEAGQNYLGGAPFNATKDYKTVALYGSILLDLFDQADEMTRSDLDGAIGAQVMRIMRRDPPRLENSRWV
jgi:hypothetical protein